MGELIKRTSVTHRTPEISCRSFFSTDSLRRRVATSQIHPQVTRVHASRKTAGTKFTN